MLRMTPMEKEFRTNLLSHLFHFHGRFQINSGDKALSLQELEKMHEMMHKDGYACPPHEHKDAGPYDLGKIKLSLGKRYLNMIRKVASGDLG